MFGHAGRLKRDSGRSKEGHGFGISHLSGIEWSPGKKVTQKWSWGLTLSLPIDKGRAISITSISAMMKNQLLPLIQPLVCPSHYASQ